jgi:hypothetical protein
MKGQSFHFDQNIIEKAIIIVIAKMKNRAIIKILSATFSKSILFFSFFARIDKKERRLHAINRIVATPVNSSIIVAELYLDILSEVKTIRQNPNKLEEVLKIC